MSWRVEHRREGAPAKAWDEVRVEEGVGYGGQRTGTGARRRGASKPGGAIIRTQWARVGGTGEREGR